MTVLEIIFWAAAACVVYTYVGYPVLLALVAATLGRQTKSGPAPISASVVIAAKNEAEAVGRRVREFAGAISRAGIAGEIVIVSDGSTDGTAEAARDAARQTGVACEVIELAESVGKAAALTRGCAAARHEVLVFGDARQTWSPDALPRLMACFGDASVGGVSGELVLETAEGALAGVGLYWRYEKWIRQTEGRVDSVVGATGAISAVRRELFTPIPAGTILDDVYWPLCVVLKGRRVVTTAGAVAYDRLPERSRDEFRRKVRTLAGNFQLAARLPRALVPLANRIWLQYVSHKLMRLLVPWLLLTMVGISAAIPTALYRTLLAAQLAGYLVGVLGLVSAGAGRIKILSAAASFVVLNAAAWVAFWVWISGRTTRSWKKTAYTRPVTATMETVKQGS